MDDENLTPDEYMSRKLSEMASDQVRRRANDTMGANAKRDGLRYARVPGSGESCGFCLMLASRGFVYKSAESAGEGSHYHRGCRCKIVPGFEGMKVEGYDPDELYDRWRHPEKYKDDKSALKELEELIKGYTEPDEVSEINALVKSMGERTDRLNALTKRMNEQGRTTALVKEWKKEKALFDEDKALYDKLNKRLSGIEKARAKAIRAVVSKMRKLGVPDGLDARDIFVVQSSRIVTTTVNNALEYMPTDWIDTLKKGNVKLKTTLEGRSFYDPADNSINLCVDSDELTALHEMVHAVETLDPEFRADTLEFFKKRTDGKTLKLLREITGDVDYGEVEYAFDMGRHCIDPYVYKFYGDPNNLSIDPVAFEVTTTGVECLYRTPWSFLKDPKLLKYVIKKLRRL